MGVCLRVFSDTQSRQRMRKVSNRRTRIVVSVKKLDKLHCYIVRTNICTVHMIILGSEVVYEANDLMQNFMVVVVTPFNVKLHHISLLLIPFFITEQTFLLLRIILYRIYTLCVQTVVCWLAPLAYSKRVGFLPGWTSV